MRNPRERIGDGLRILLVWLDGGEVAVELMVLNNLDRRGRHIIAFLVTGHHKPRLGMHARERLAQSPTDDVEFLPVCGDTDHGAVVFAEVGALLPALADDERAIWRELHRVG